MQSPVTCECGNTIEALGEQADPEYRCPRCGRRVFEDEADFQHLIDDDHRHVSGKNRSHAGPRADSQHRIGSSFGPASDPDATVIHNFPIADDTETPKDALRKHDDGFEFISPSKKGSSAVQDADTPPSSGDSRGSKYDLSERVMRPIAKPATPIVPYAGGGEFGIHRILRLHQKGGMGRILVAYDLFLKREVAIKELHPDVAEDDNIVRRFIGEAEITAQLEHPGVVPIYRLEQGSDGLPYYTMKMIKGETLQNLIKAYHRKPNRETLLNLIRRLVSVAKTIGFAHSKGVIHRDLKPANVMIGEYGETLVMDWGLAKPYNHFKDEPCTSIVYQTNQSRPELTMVGAIIGTPAFMSPEQAIAAENIVGPLSDVFSLGTVLYYLLTGQTAFSGRSTQEVLEKVRACNPIPPSHIKPHVPHGLDAICLKAMAKLPENRYQGASEFADDLCRWLDGGPVSAEGPSTWSRIRWWVVRQRTLVVSVLCTMFLSVTLTSVGWWLFEGNQNNTKQDEINVVDQEG